MLKKLTDAGTRYFTEKMGDPSSMLSRFLATSKNIEHSTMLIKRIYYALWAFLVLGVLNFMISLWYLRASFIFGMTFWCFIGIFISGVTFIVSTNYEEFNFWSRKKLNIFTVAGFMTLTGIMVFAMVYCKLILPLIFLIPINRDITVGMVVWLSRLLYALFTLIPGITIGFKFAGIINQPENWETIDQFKIRKHIDMRKDKEFLYDLSIIRRMDNGKEYLIKEVDRQRHMLLSGVTGTGKTSSALIPAVASDLDQKAYNEDYAKKEIMKRILSVGDIHPKKGMTDEDFSIDSFWAEEKEGKEFLDSLRLKAQSAGLTVIAPNADFADAVYELATIRGFKVNRVDPIPADVSTGKMKPGFKGFNPLYISPDFTPVQHRLEVFRKSRMFSDVLQALYEQSGKSDPYFTSLNRNMTTMLSILIMLTYPWLHDGKQPDVTAVQEVINDFSQVRNYIYALAKIVGIANDPKAPLTWVGDLTLEWIVSHKFGEYQFIVSQLAFDFLGAGRAKMEDQARGLRVIINEFLTDPLVKNVLCAEETVDIDRALAKGEITVVNYGLELGMSIATGFGLFYCLSFNQAVLRRPGTERTRLLHLYYCDEFPVLLHKDMESIFTLFRQFRVCFLCAFQTSAQFDRNEATKYLKNVVISNVGHHIVYGNCSKEDMELYEALAGKKLEFMDQETTSETALSSLNTAMSFSTRTTPQFVNRVEGYRLRNKDFQEVTVFGVSGGDHVDPFDGKLSFLTKAQKEGKGRCQMEWGRYVEEGEDEATFAMTSETYDYGDTLNVEDVLRETKLAYLKNENPVSESQTQEENIIPPTGPKTTQGSAGNVAPEEEKGQSQNRPNEAYSTLEEEDLSFY